MPSATNSTTLRVLATPPEPGAEAHDATAAASAKAIHSFLIFNTIRLLAVGFEKNRAPADATRDSIRPSPRGSRATTANIRSGGPRKLPPLARKAQVTGASFPIAIRRSFAFR
jgi:hypothetical protein